MRDLYLGIEFAKAVQRHFKLEGHEVKADMPVSTGRDEAFAVTMTVMLQPDDLVAIGNLMQGDAVVRATKS